jgi:hypothetical protein
VPTSDTAEYGGNKYGGLPVKSSVFIKWSQEDRRGPAGVALCDEKYGPVLGVCHHLIRKPKVTVEAR